MHTAQGSAGHSSCSPVINIAMARSHTLSFMANGARQGCQRGWSHAAEASAALPAGGIDSQQRSARGLQQAGSPWRRGAHATHAKRQQPQHFQRRAVPGGASNACTSIWQQRSTRRAFLHPVRLPTSAARLAACCCPPSLASLAANSHGWPQRPPGPTARSCRLPPAAQTPQWPWHASSSSLRAPATSRLTS